MAVTKISDLAIVPQTFADYVEKLVMKRSNLIKSGIMQTFEADIPAKGKTIVAPAFTGFVADDEVLSDSAALTINSVGSTSATAVINFRGTSFGSNDLAGALAGKDPLGNLAIKYADYWTRALNKSALSALKGAAAGVELDHVGLILNDQSLAVITNDMALNTLQLMGEYADQLTHVIMHSAVRTYLMKLDKLTVGTTGSSWEGLEFYQGRVVIVDDSLVPAGAIYDTYFVGTGAIAYADGSDPDKMIEIDRDILAGDDVTTSRKRYIIHPYGSTFDGTPVGVSPTNIELAAATSWSAEDTAEDKRFPVRVLRHLIA